MMEKEQKYTKKFNIKVLQWEAKQLNDIQVLIVKEIKEVSRLGIIKFIQSCEHKNTPKKAFAKLPKSAADWRNQCVFNRFIKDLIRSSIHNED